MIQNKGVVNKEEQLLQAREAGLNEAKQVDAMQAHGKVLGMDTFSWMNPQIDMLATLLESFPFSILWVGTRSQIEKCLTLYPALSGNIETIILHDSPDLKLSNSGYEKINTIACVDGIEHALEFVKSLKRKKGVLIYTNENEAVLKDKAAFEKFVQFYK